MQDESQARSLQKTEEKQTVGGDGDGYAGLLGRVSEGAVLVGGM